MDGFAIAEKLLDDSEAAYLTLSTIPVHAHASGNAGITIQPAEPVAVLSHHKETGQLMQVRWNNADRAGLDVTYERLGQWYEAAA